MGWREQAWVCQYSSQFGCDAVGVAKIKDSFIVNITS